MLGTYASFRHVQVLINGLKNTFPSLMLHGPAVSSTVFSQLLQLKAEKVLVAEAISAASIRVTIVHIQNRIRIQCESVLLHSPLTGWGICFLSPFLLPVSLQPEALIPSFLKTSSSAGPMQYISQFDLPFVWLKVRFPRRRWRQWRRRRRQWRRQRFCHYRAAAFTTKLAGLDY
ncbi:hypothetical protein XENOCAPTIV_007111 [Xenoophorus captivus]|uniref:Uncharacterized protein n=1 Tax=Xenoophorus captivus TaxID=1517983 RepID=A0ABV0SGY4_9TELE